MGVQLEFAVAAAGGDLPAGAVSGLEVVMPPTTSTK